MFGINGFEFLIIFLFAFLVFGPERLPAIGRVIGRAIRQFRRTRDEVSDLIRDEVIGTDEDPESVKETFRDIERMLEGLSDGRDGGGRR